jgi:flap endonuclease-1
VRCFPVGPVGANSMGSSEDRVRKGAEKLTKFLNSKQQGRLDGFFTVKPKDKKASPSKADAKGKGKEAPKKGTKRKVGLIFFCLSRSKLQQGDDKAESGSSKKAKTKK